MIEDELARRLRTSLPWAVLYADLDDLGIFNETFGAQRGDEAIATLERIVRTAARRDDFVDHRGGDDFMILTVPQRAQKIAEEIVASFDREMRRAISVSIAIVTSERPSIKHVAQIDAIATELKSLAKSKLGSNYVKDQHR